MILRSKRPGTGILPRRREAQFLVEEGASVEAVGKMGILFIVRHAQASFLEQN